MNKFIKRCFLIEEDLEKIYIFFKKKRAATFLKFIDTLGPEYEVFSMSTQKAKKYTTKFFYEGLKVYT